MAHPGRTPYPQPMALSLTIDQDLSKATAWTKAVQKQLPFATSAALLVPKMIEGFNVTLMAYGQTGSGKSFTMYGPGDKYGELATEPLRGVGDAALSLIGISRRTTLSKVGSFPLMSI